MVDSINGSKWNHFKGHAKLKIDEAKFYIAPPESAVDCHRKELDIKNRKDTFERSK